MGRFENIPHWTRETQNQINKTLGMGEELRKSVCPRHPQFVSGSRILTTAEAIVRDHRRHRDFSPRLPVTESRRPSTIVEQPIQAFIAILLEPFAVAVIVAILSAIIPAL